MAAWSSSSEAGARGIRILDPEEERRKATPWSTSLGVDEVDREEEAAARARGCDVYVGHGGDVRRMAAWLRAELEMLGVPCVAADRRRYGDAPAHAAALAAMDGAVVGVVLVTPATLSNAYAIEEVRAFLGRGALMPVFVGVRRGDFAVADDVVERRGDLWEKHGGKLWMAYDGLEEPWREAVQGLALAEPVVEVRAGDLRDRVLDVLEILGARLGRPAVAPAVRAWRAEAYLEIPFPWNAGFLGREKELLDLESMLRDGARAHDKAAGKRPMLPNGAVRDGLFLDGVVCISGGSGAGKTELALEFAHRHSHEYKKVLWVHGEPRYLRQNYLKLADHLGIAVGDNFLQSNNGRAPRSLRDIEGDAIAKINKELTRDIPYLVVIDNVESEKDWWDGRAIGELLPRGVRRTRVIVTTRLAGGLRGVRRLALGNLDASNAMRLMKGTRTFTVDDTAILRDIQGKVDGVALGLALVGGILSELPIGPAELRRAMRHAPHRAPTWGATEDAALRDNPGLAQLLDACFTLVGREAAGLGTVAERLLEVSSYFAPVPIPASMLVDAAFAAADVKTRWRWLKRTAWRSCTSPRAAPSFAGGAEQEALATLLRLGVARRATRDGCVSVHGVFRLFSRKVRSGSGRAARAVVNAIAAGGSAAHQNAADHTWAACLSLFRFEAPGAAVELPPPDLSRFVTRAVLPLAARCVVGYSACSAALELLREATDGVHEAEDRYIKRHPPRSNGAYMELDAKVYQELARTRAELLVMRARVMVRSGDLDIAEDHCHSAINILEVVAGDCHPETLAVRAFLEQDVLVQTMDA
ncbi:hypothetical protein BAE44_0007036 [Dichanthelium oligosanthes]|uniref:AAA+ ATPase domain-containing protein n=1 Tax=Dichanthelium oligosanthes TaxID=888268 RepID=A0A1E5W3R4_9POAL|nr:hypothetical protein BAE44_0007036 [Dichanthelium oligosanthes]